MKTKRKTKSLTLREVTVLRDCLRRRVDDLRSKIERCAGSLYPAIMEKQVSEIEDLFLKLTDDTLTEEE